MYLSQPFLKWQPVKIRQLFNFSRTPVWRGMSPVWPGLSPVWQGMSLPSFPNVIYVSSKQTFPMRYHHKIGLIFKSLSCPALPLFKGGRNFSVPPKTNYNDYNIVFCQSVILIHKSIQNVFTTTLFFDHQHIYVCTYIYINLIIINHW